MAQQFLQKTQVQLLAPTWQHITTCNTNRSNAFLWYLQAEHTHGQRRWHGGPWELRSVKHSIVSLVERRIHHFLLRGWEWIWLVPFALSWVAAATLNPPPDPYPKPFFSALLLKPSFMVAERVFQCGYVLSFVVHTRLSSLSSGNSFPNCTVLKYS